MKSPRLLVALIIGLMLLLAWAVLVWDPVPENGAAHSTLELTGVPTGGDFTLQSSKGPFSLESQRGKVVLLYFGYTMCPDICPTALAFLGQALSTLEPGELEQVQVVFVSVDPERDTPERLEIFSTYFHESILGVTGTPQEVAEVAGMYGAAYRRVESDSAVGYMVDHTSLVYVINQDGELLDSMPHGTAPEVIVKTVRPLLQQPPAQ
jgi:protein SCO1/2